MITRYGKKLSEAGVHPFPFRNALAFRAVAIVARIVRYLRVAAFPAHLRMKSELAGAAVFNVGHHSGLLRRQGAPLTAFLTVKAEHVRNFACRTLRRVRSSALLRIRENSVRKHRIRRKYSRKDFLIRQGNLRRRPGQERQDAHLPGGRARRLRCLFSYVFLRKSHRRVPLSESVLMIRMCPPCRRLNITIDLTGAKGAGSVATVTPSRPVKRFVMQYYHRKTCLYC